MKKTTFWIILLLLAAGLYAGWQHFFGSKEPATSVIDQPAIPAVVEPPPIRYPVPAEEALAGSQDGAAAEKPQPLPELEESDASLRAALAQLYAGQALDRLLLFENFAKRVVITTNNLMTPSLPVKRRPTQPLPGVFLVTGTGDDMVISADNFPRYTPFVHLAQAAEPRQLVALYVRFYPLLQQASENLGYPGYFNDRVIEVIDHLLATPPVTAPLRLVRPEVLYQFADPQLEALSSGQKLMIRMGRDNADQLKARLRELRQALTRLPEGGQG